ncbi:GPW/gp25 family protein [Francisella philomiragia]|uniref:GPW/gp25 family protein n=1 Tax=Francisella philomiragia TaxID=28110 RepID=A0ABS1GDL7_9GAMM|nr:GPW/gp25 family protein [Francisella philomiragia]MBK2258997.1 GPW/gp25 family protein [Francisella philomiragia]MBK2302688.1 GPW/gp25 family protein [Francisella philomiragia]
MQGISRDTGKYLSDIDHVRQSIRDILTTPKGSRVMLRDYGSDLPKYRDYPINRTLIAKIYKATAEAIDKWEPRVRLSGSKFKIETDETGKLALSIDFIYRPNGQLYSLNEVYL